MHPHNADSYVTAIPHADSSQGWVHYQRSSLHPLRSAQSLDHMLDSTWLPELHSHPAGYTQPEIKDERLEHFDPSQLITDRTLIYIKMISKETNLQNVVCHASFTIKG